MHWLAEISSFNFTEKLQIYFGHYLEEIHSLSRAINCFKLVSLDIKRVILQAKTFDREVFVRPPYDQRNNWIE